MSDNPAFSSSDADRGSPHIAVDANGVSGPSLTKSETSSSLSKKEISSKASNNSNMDLLYAINDIPPWYLVIFMGLQHYLTAFGALLAVPLILAPSLCIVDGDVATAELIGTMFFVSGLVTLMQTTFGTRLPIVQGGTFSYLAPTFAILSLPHFACPAVQDISNITNQTLLDSIQADRTETWQVRIREIQGAIMLGSLFQIVIGVCGVMGLLLKYIGPLAIAPTIALVGIALFQPASAYCAGQWWIALTTIVFVVLFSQYLRNLDIPCFTILRRSDKKTKCVKGAFPLFRLFPVILAICLSWLICYILTITNTLPDDGKSWGHKARTDTNIGVLNQAAWFRFPYPFQWGLPTVSVAGVFGMLAGVLAGMIESVGDYYACARLAGAPPPPVHAINRGIFIEGIGCLLAGMWGTGNGTTSYSENIGAIGITKVGARVVVQTGGFIMLLLGMLGKFGALFVTIPEPIIGGIFMVTFGMIVAVGISNLQYVDLNSSRNLFIIGFSFFFGLSLPQWMAANPHAIQTGEPTVDQIFTVLLSTSMFVGGSVGFFLDNTIPGTQEERGIILWRKQLETEEDNDHKSPEAAIKAEKLHRAYDLPWCMGCVRESSCFKYLPFCPTFEVHSCSCRKRKSPEDDSMDEVRVEGLPHATDDNDLNKAEQNGSNRLYPNVTHRSPPPSSSSASNTYL